MSLATISVRVDEQDKRRFEAFCNETGLNTSAAINLFIKTVIRRNEIPFRIIGDPFYSAENMERLRRNIEEMETGNATAHEVIDVDEGMD